MSNFPQNPGRVVVAGDWHANPVCACQVVNRAADKGISVIAHVGDYGYWGERLWKDRKFLDRVEAVCAKRGVTIVLCKGNHEHHDLLDALPRDENGVVWIRPHIVYAPNGVRWTWNGVRWLSMGGAHSMVGMLGKRKPGIDWFPQETISDTEIADADRSDR